MKVEYIEESAVKKAFTFEVDAELVDREIATQSKEHARKAKLPGFRPGKIPPEVIKRRFLPQVLEEVAEKLVNKVVFDELEGRGLRPLAAPKVTEVNIAEHAPLTFRAAFEVLPIIELPEYKGLEAKSRLPQATEEAIDKEVEELREQAARYDPVEGRVAREGDFLVVDVLWKPADGGEGGHDEHTLVELGASQNHADLNTALIGIGPGEVRSVRLTYPSDHPSKNLAGQTVDYTITLHSIKNKVVPAVDDEFAKDLGEFDSLAALRDDIRQRLLTQDAVRVDREAKEALIGELVQHAGFEVPEALVEHHVSQQLQQFARALALQGVDPRQAEIDWKKLGESRREQAVHAAKAEILLDEIARREQIEVKEEEVEAEVARVAERLKKTREAVRSRMEKDGDLGALRARLRENQTLDLIKANARLTFE